MNFQQTDDANYLTNRMISGNIEIGVHRVLFGYRVRAGYIGNGYYDIDYCCGDDPEWIRRVYSAVLTVLTSREETDAFKGFPVQNTKPMINDRVCFVNLIKMMGKDTRIKTNIQVDPIEPTSMFDIPSMFKL